MLLGSFCFALMSSLINGVGRWCDWQIIAIARTFLALTFASGLATASGARLVFLRPPVLWVRSVSGSMALLTGFYALSHLPVADVLTLTNMFPIWVAVLSWPLLGIRPSGETWAAVLSAIVGVVLIQQGGRTAGMDQEMQVAAKVPEFAWGIAALSSMFSAVAMLGLHKLYRVDARAIVAHFSFVSLLFSIGSWYVFPHYKPLEFSGQTLLMLLGVGITGTVGQIFLTKAFAAGDPSRVSVLALSQVGFAAVLDLVFWGRTFHMATVLGMIMVIVPSGWLLIRRAIASGTSDKGGGDLL